MKSFKYIILTIISILLLNGCKTTETIYYDGGYAVAVYKYLNNDEMPIGEQIDLLESIISGAANEGKPVLPGVHAHLGLLYFDSGNAEQGRIHFEKEKALFPESTHYIDFLLNTDKEGE